MSHPSSCFIISPAWFVIGITLFVFLLFTPQAMAQSASAAKSRVAMAGEMLQAERFDDVESSLQQAEKFLEGLPAAEKDPIVKAIAEVRAKVEAAKKAVKARGIKSQIDRDLRQADEDAPSNPGGSGDRLKKIAARLDSDEVKSLLEAADIANFKARIGEVQKKLGEEGKKEAVTGSLSAARSRMMQARGALESRRVLNIEVTLQEAEAFLEGLPESQRAPILKEIAEIRAGVGPAIKAEKVKEIEGRLDRDLGAADKEIVAHPEISDRLIKAAATLLASEEATTVLDAPRIAEYQARLTEVKKKLAAKNKKVDIERAQRFLKRLEEGLTGDPFAGKDDLEAYKASRDLESNYRAVGYALEDIPKGDPDVRAIEEKLAVFKKKMDAASSSWSAAQVEARIKAGWAFASQDSAGWEEEKPRAGVKPNESWMMHKTASAARNAAYWLDDEQIKKLKAEHPDNAVVKATFAEAEKTRDGAAAKLNAAFEAAMAVAEKMPTPSGGTRFDRVIASWMASDAEGCFKGTRYQEPNVARAKALDAKWEKELLTMQKAAAELRAKFSKEADAAWPAIVSKIGPDDDFKPRQLASSKGDRILMKKIYNRSGWDFDGGQYEFTVRIDGVPIGGNFTKEINDYIQATWEKMKAPPLDSWEEWDVIAVVVGPATIRKRVTTELIAADTREVIGKIEGYKDEPGVEIRIIGLHAGPVAVGSK